MADLLSDNAAHYMLAESAMSGGNVVVGPSETLSYEDMSTRVSALASYLARDYPKGTAVGILSGSSCFFIVAYLAILKSGCVAVLLDRNASAEVLDDEVRRTELRHVFAEERLVTKLKGFDVSVSNESFIDSLEGNSVGPVLETSFIGNDTDLAVIFFTSGTTSRRKGVMLSHRNIIANTESIIAYLSLRNDECACVVLPLHHVGGASVLHSHLRVGGQMALYNGIFEASPVKGMVDFECTSIFGVPSTFSVLVRKMGMTQQRYPRLRYVAQGGGIMSLALVHELRDGLPGVDFVVSYGQTEAASRISYLAPELLESKLGSIGKGMPGMEVRVINEDADDVKPGEIGEIIARGENVMLGYLDDPVATSRTIVEGWLHTRDAATVDEDGYIYPKYRLDGVINSGGYRVSPEEVENLIQSCEEVTHCGVVGVPHPELGDAVVAYFTTEGEESAVLSAVKQICFSKLQPYKQPRFFKILDSLPLNSSTKLDRETLRMRAEKEFGDV